MLKRIEKKLLQPLDIEIEYVSHSIKMKLKKNKINKNYLLKLTKAIFL